MTEIASDNKIFYDKYTKFCVNPSMNKKMSNEFINYVNFIHRNNNFFFWTFDSNSDTIVINENIQVVKDNIFDQLMVIYHWLYQRGYKLEGSTYYRTNNLIEYISMDTIISHYTLFDEIDRHYRILMTNSKKKMLSEINSHNKLKLLKLYNKWPVKKFRKTKQKNFKVNNLRQKDRKAIKLMKKKLTNTESQIKTLIMENNFFLKTCGLISCFTIGIYLILSTIQYNNNSNIAR